MHAGACRRGDGTNLALRMGPELLAAQASTCTAAWARARACSWTCCSPAWRRRARCRIAAACTSTRPCWSFTGEPGGRAAAGSERRAAWWRAGAGWPCRGDQACFARFARRSLEAAVCPVWLPRRFCCPDPDGSARCPCSRMHAIERHREAHEQAQMNAYAAAVEERRRRDAPGLAAAAEVHGRGSAGAPGNREGGDGGSSWQQILRLDPIAQKLQRSKLARMAFRRCGRLTPAAVPCGMPARSCPAGPCAGMLSPPALAGPASGNRGQACRSRPGLAQDHAGQAEQVGCRAVGLAGGRQRAHPAPCCARPDPQLRHPAAHGGGGRRGRDEQQRQLHRWRFWRPGGCPCTC